MARCSKSKVVKRKKRVQKKASISWTWKKRLFVVAVGFFVVGVTHTLFCSSLTKIDVFDVRGTQRVDIDDVVQVIEDVISGNILSCIRRDNYFFVNKGRIKDRILEDRRIKDAVIKKEFSHKIVVDIIEYDTVPIWCIGSMHGECFVVSDGYIKDHIDINSDIITQNKHFIIVDEGNDIATIGDMVIASDNLDKMALLGEELIYTFCVGIEQPYIVSSRGSHEVRFVTDEGWYILIDLTQDVSEIIDIAQLFMKKVPLPSRRNDLEYIDMRFLEKIFYKMNDGVEQSEEDIDVIEEVKQNDESQKTHEIVG